VQQDKKNSSHPLSHHWFMMEYGSKLAWTAIAIVLMLVFIIAPVAADRMVREDGTDHDGKDYNTLFPGSPGYNGTAEGCSEGCMNDAACNAGTFNPRDQSCWLKQVVPAASARPGVTSFLKVQGNAEAMPAATAPTTKKSPGFEASIAVLGCLGMLGLKKLQ
jgi:hypothetical protein